MKETTVSIVGPLWQLHVATMPTLRAEPVFPSQGSGFAASIVGGLFALGLVLAIMFWAGRGRR
jgi:hypothetical protein